MPGSVPSMAVQKKQSADPPSQGPLSTRTTDRPRKGNGFERMGVANGLNVDERLKAARERREAHQKLLASRELSRLEREQQARRYYEQQLQERKKKLLEQRLKEERRRAAVEEKRQQRLKEEKARYESAVRRTLEKSQRAQKNLSQNTRGRKLTKNVPRRSPLTAWEKNLISRLLTPTCSFLARSKSAACQSGEEVVHVCRRAASFHSMTTTTPTSHQTQHHSGSVHHRPSASPSPNNRNNSLAQIKAAKQQDAYKKNSNIRSASINTSVKPITVTQSRTASTSPEQTPQRSISRQPTPLQLELPSVPEEDVVVCTSALAPGNARPARTSAEAQQNKMRDENPTETLCSSRPDPETEAITRTAGNGCPSQVPPHPASQLPEVVCRPSAGTTDPEEASRLLAEKRREARLQREREEQERLQREQAERRSHEELEYRRAKERAQQQAEAQRLIEEKKRREEEEQRRAEEERAQAMREAALLQKQREEEQAKERVKAEHMKQEREILARKEEAERQARKQRLEEIMRRTRRTDSPDMKAVPIAILPNDTQPKENTELMEDGVRLPVGTKSSQLRLNSEDDIVPVVVFKERRSLRTLTGLEEIQTHQRAEVI
uniref:ensconsin isoform X2 n=1 Tax=Monopterus albus TaxID=43700 RepID=UPI0009B47D17|nr:ensconsin-like isoform X2 [Monopterus albus]